jgi:hypothetical protein
LWWWRVRDKESQYEWKKMEDWEGKPGKDQSSYPIQTMLAVEGKRDETRVHYADEADGDLHDSRVKNSHRIEYR